MTAWLDRARPTRPGSRVPTVMAGMAAAALVTALALTGCSASRNTSAPSADRAAGGVDNGAAACGGAGGSGAEVPAAPAVPQGDQKPGTSQQAPTQLEPALRSLVYTGMVTVKADDVAKAADRAVDIAVGADGIVGSDQRTIDGDRSEAQLILRVPAEHFTTTLNNLAKLGVEEARAVQVEDVTEAVVDLDARLATQRASVERVRVLLARAQTIGEVVSIESELTRREADLASLEQRKNKLADLVALSTITLSLHGPATPDTPSTPDTGFVAGLKSGWKGFLVSVKVVLTAAGYLLPWAIAFGIPLWLVIWRVRHRRRATRTA
jgi:uncharacterized protein DUF4349